MLPCDKVYPSQLPHPVLSCGIMSLTCGIMSLTWLVYLMWQISGIGVSGDFREPHAFSHHCSYEAQGSH